MFICRRVIIIFFLYSINISANDYLPNNILINSLISQKSCTLDYARINSSDEGIIDILRVSAINSNDWKNEFSSIKTLLDQGNLSCFLKINLTAIYAQRIYAKGDLINAESLFSKILTYKIGDRKFKKDIRDRLKIIKLEIKNFNLPLDSNISDSITRIRSGEAYQNINYEEKSIALQETIKSLKMQLDASIDSEVSKSFEIEGLENKLFDVNLNITNLTNNLNKKIKTIDELDQKITQISSNISLSDSPLNNNKLSFSYLNLFLFTSAIILITVIFANANSTSSSPASESEPEESEPEELEPEELDPLELEILNPRTRQKLHDNEKLLKCIQSIIGKTKISLADGYYFYSYSQGVSENIILDGDNELEPSYLLDRLIDTFFNESPIFIKSQYRFMKSDEIINANHDGAYDAAFFYKHGEIKKLPIIIKSNRWKHIFDNQISSSQEAVKIKETPEKDGIITGIGKLPRT